ncbi:MAG: hypothetical protein OHK0028_20190 [Deltaproteobacteria bacterium]
MSRKIGIPRARRAASAGFRDEGVECVHHRRVLLLDLPVESAFQPPSDVTEAEGSIRLLLEIPGVPVESVQVRVMGDRIEVTGEKTPDFPGCETAFLCLERTFGKFRRAFEVRGSVNMGEISARLSKGILTITIPKIPERRGRERRIPVTAG